MRWMFGSMARPCTLGTKKADISFKRSQRHSETQRARRLEPLVEFMKQARNHAQDVKLLSSHRAGMRGRTQPRISGRESAGEISAGVGGRTTLARSDVKEASLSGPLGKQFSSTTDLDRSRCLATCKESNPAGGKRAVKQCIWMNRQLAKLVTLCRAGARRPDAESGMRRGDIGHSHCVTAALPWVHIFNVGRATTGGQLEQWATEKTSVHVSQRELCHPRSRSGCQTSGTNHALRLIIGRFGRREDQKWSTAVTRIDRYLVAGHVTRNPELSLAYTVLTELTAPCISQLAPARCRSAAYISAFKRQIDILEHGVSGKGVAMASRESGTYAGLSTGMGVPLTLILPPLVTLIYPTRASVLPGLEWPGGDALSDRVELVLDLNEPTMIRPLDGTTDTPAQAQRSLQELNQDSNHKQKLEFGLAAGHDDVQIWPVIRQMPSAFHITSDASVAGRIPTICLPGHFQGNAPEEHATIPPVRRKSPQVLGQHPAIARHDLGRPALRWGYAPYPRRYSETHSGSSGGFELRTSFCLITPLCRPSIPPCGESMGLRRGNGGPVYLVQIHTAAASQVLHHVGAGGAHGKMDGYIMLVSHLIWEFSRIPRFYASRPDWLRTGGRTVHRD
ncbi:hypothetical protein DFH06DRAFT_1133356 [Mycena polygramma]|nr:hypothetical protein DFH06DRAFT_1133356 [Mycena polygramma]